MWAPNSYTKENVVEIQSHGGSLVVHRILELALSHGARMAEPGEFTKRAFLKWQIGFVASSISYGYYSS